MARRGFRKYLNKKVRVGDDVFDSTNEYKRYLELVEMEKNGEISNLQRQVKFVLLPTQYDFIERYSTKTGKRLKDKIVVLEKECAYYADFVYLNEYNELVVEDTKGMRTTEYVIKRKMMLYFYNIVIHEV